MANQPENGILEDFRIQFLECWQRLPNKGLFFVLLIAWLALFHFLGNSTLGYISTPSLLQWMHLVYGSEDTSGSDDSRGRLIPFVVLALFWWKRKELLALQLRMWWPGLLLVALALALHVLGYMGQQPRISIVALFTGIYGLTGLVWGPKWLRDSFFPFCLFAFCVPLGWSAVSVTFPMRLLVCRLVELIASFILQIDVLRVGTALIDPTGHYQYDVAAACSGIRSLFATVAVAIIYAMLSFRSWWKRGVLMVSAVPLAIIGNTLRMLTIIIAAEIGGQKAGTYVHDGGPFGILSLLPYVAAFAGLMLLGHWLRGNQSKPDAPPAVVQPNGSGHL
ncbi:MAG TPA: exosortase/archaeosortase family protein [Candidatus Paceibacterota bacterium]|nr:exosortase/archaeosortase family protein [Verrucomicrobiota bacterium]HSA11111.1 exosortase/archaeosortase family protein [Candidatus Paceibacterota bacterium]